MQVLRRFGPPYLYLSWFLSFFSLRLACGNRFQFKTQIHKCVCVLALDKTRFSFGSPAQFHAVTQAVVSSAFLFNRFRRDRWWYGVPLLLRGPMLSLSVVCATNFPAAQVAAGTVIIAASLILQIFSWPWKLPLLNLLDTVAWFVSRFFFSCFGGGLCHEPRI